MKKNVKSTITLVVAGLIFLGASENKAHAGNKEWATVGKILTGIIGAQIAFDIIDSDYGYTTQTTHRQRRYRNKRSNPRMIIETTRVYESPNTIIENTRVYEKKRSRRHHNRTRNYRHNRKHNRKNKRHCRRNEYRDHGYRNYDYIEYRYEDHSNRDYGYRNYGYRSHNRKRYCER